MFEPMLDTQNSHASDGSFRCQYIPASIIICKSQHGMKFIFHVWPNHQLEQLYEYRKAHLSLYFE